MKCEAANEKGCAQDVGIRIGDKELAKYPIPKKRQEIFCPITIM